MFRIHLSRLLGLGALLFVVGCNSTGDRPGLFSSCHSCGSTGSQPGWFSRTFRSTSSQPVMAPSGECCGTTDRIVSGPYMPPMQPGTMVVPTQPPPPQPNTIPRIDENGKQMPWDPNQKTYRSGTTTSSDDKSTKGGP
jgi:hypothetical protein